MLKSTAWPCIKIHADNVSKVVLQKQKLTIRVYCIVYMNAGRARNGIYDYTVTDHTRILSSSKVALTFVAAEHVNNDFIQYHLKYQVWIIIHCLNTSDVTCTQWISL